MSEEEAAFLAALKADPADDTTRLVYADWLDERSDPRARYLRLVCTLVGLPESDLVDSAAGDELRELSKRVAPKWQEAVGARFEFALLEFHPFDRATIVNVLERVLNVEPGTEQIRLQAVINAAPAAIRSPLTFPAAYDLHWEWRRYRDWFHSKPHAVVRPVPCPFFSETGLFDIVLRKLPGEFWPNWPYYYKSPVSALLNLPTREAADLVRRLPATLFRGLTQLEVRTTLARIRLAFNVRDREILPPDALAVMPHGEPAGDGGRP